MGLWKDTVKTALIGSGQQTLSLAVLPESPLGSLLAQIEPDPPEAYLLKVAGVLTIYRWVSWSPEPRSLTPISACDPDEWAPCTDPARQILEQILGGSHRDLLPEWLQLARQAQQRIPSDLLPTFLHEGRQSVALRPDLLPVLGKRGRWLAAQNSAWSYARDSQDPQMTQTDPTSTEATPQNLDAIWQTGESRQRLALLEETLDRDPEQVRTWIQSTWKKDPAEFRLSSLQIIRRDLKADDEAWLEPLLSQDRSKTVRSTAADLLSRLPQSALCQRMRDRVEPLLQWVRSSKGSAKGSSDPSAPSESASPSDPSAASVPSDQTNSFSLKITLPSEFTAEMERDGLVPKPPASLGEKAWWLRQMVARIPPQAWCDRWQVSPAALVDAVDPQWRDLLQTGWAEAAARFQDQTWAEVLLNRVWQAPPAANRAQGSKPSESAKWLASLTTEVAEPIQSLATVFSGDRLQAFCLTILRNDPDVLATVPSVWILLGACPSPWSLELTQAFRDSCCRIPPSTPILSHYTFQSYLLKLANCIDPDHHSILAPTLLTTFSSKGHYAAQMIEAFLTRLEFRYQLRHAFSPHATQNHPQTL